MSTNYENIEARNQELLAKIHEATQHGDENDNMRWYYDELIANNQDIIEGIVGRILQNQDNDYEDLMNEARISVWNCAKNYDPGKNTQFSTYISRTIEQDLKGKRQDLNMETKLTKQEKRLMSDMHAFITDSLLRGHTEQATYDLVQKRFGFEGLQLLQLQHRASLDDSKLSDYGSSEAASTGVTDASTEHRMEWEELSQLLTEEEIKILTARIIPPAGQEKPLSFRNIANEFSISYSSARNKYLDAVQKVQKKYPDAELPQTVFQQNPDRKRERADEPSTLLDLAHYVELVCDKEDIKEINDLAEKGTSSTFYKKIKRLYETIVKSSSGVPTFKSLHESMRECFFELFRHIFSILSFQAAYDTIQTFFKGKIKLTGCGLYELQAYRTLIMWTLDVMADDSDDAEMRLEEMFDSIDSICYVLYTIKKVSLDINNLIGDLLLLDEDKRQEFCEYFLENIWTEQNAIGTIRSEIEKYM